MYAIGRFFRWLFLDPIRETLMAITAILVVAYCVATSWSTLTDDEKKPPRKSNFTSKS